jgi:glutamine amidotransferase
VPFEEGVRAHEANLHPFRFEGSPVALAHNGDLADFARMRFELLPFIRPEIARRIQGTTDSEWIAALVLSQLEDPARPCGAEALARAVAGALAVLRRLREALGIRRSSSVNLVLADGHHLVATRFCFDFGSFDADHEPPQGALRYLSQWYTFGRDYGLHDGEWKMRGGEPDSVIVASEPLTRDVSTWLEVPEYSAIYVEEGGGRRRVRTLALDA